MSVTQFFFLFLQTQYWVYIWRKGTEKLVYGRKMYTERHAKPHWKIYSNNLCSGAKEILREKIYFIILILRENIIFLHSLQGEYINSETGKGHARIRRPLFKFLHGQIFSLKIEGHYKIVLYKVGVLLISLV